MIDPIDWTLCRFDGPANRHYKILFPRTQTEIVQLENDLQIPALWQAMIAKLTKTYPPELAPVAKPFCELHSTARAHHALPIIVAMSGAIAPVASTHELRAVYGQWLVVAVVPGAENELTADLLRARHDSSSNLAGVAFTGAHLLGIGANSILQKVRECPRTTKLLFEPHPLEPPEKYWQLSASEQALLDQAIGSLEEAFREDQKALGKAREWRLGRADIARHRRARPFAAFLSKEGPFSTIRRLEKALHEYRYPYMDERLLTPSAFRHFKWLLQDHARKLATLRKQRSRALHAEQLIPTEAPTAEKV